MTPMRNLTLGLGAIAAAVAAGTYYLNPDIFGSQRPAALAAAAPREAGLVVVELFTSQACISCPPAEALLAELAGERRNVLGLELHVHYWDDYVDGPRGQWRDVHSDPTFSRRQLAYNMRLRGSQGIFTPQMIVGGTHHAVGFRRAEIDTAIIAAARANPSPPTLTPAATADGGLAVAIAGSHAAIASAGADLWLVRYEASQSTRVTSGENSGRTLTNHNIVRGFEHLGRWFGGATTLETGPLRLQPGQSCAVLLQPDESGPILAAARCPPGLAERS